MPTQVSPSPRIKYGASSILSPPSFAEASADKQAEGRIERYMLIDGNAFVHRGYHAIPSLNTKTGEATNAVYGFTMIVLKAIKELKPTHIACAFDLEGPTFRHKRYKEYKATRVKADQELYDQIPRVKQVVRALNIPIVEKQGFEADDCLGTLATHLHQQNPQAEIIIATGDLDTLQLVNHQVKVYTLRKGISDTSIYDAKAVRERYGLAPEQMVDYRALRGDPSDNIPGVKGIGEKGAIELIKEFKSLENLYKILHQEIKDIGNEITNNPSSRADESARYGAGKYQIPNKFQTSKIKPKTINLLIAQEKEARMSFELSQIDCNVPVQTEVAEYNFDAEHLEQTVKLFQELEFRSLLGKLPESESSSVPIYGQTEVADESARYNQRDGNIGKQDYQLTDTKEKLEIVLKELSSVDEIAIDTETTSLNPIEAKLVGIGLCAKMGQAYYIPAHLALASKELKQLLEDPKIRKIGHNLKYDLQVLNANHLALSPIFFDTMIASYLLNSGTRQHSLDALAFNELGYQMQPIEDLIGTGKNQITMDKVPVEKVSRYCCEDADMTFRLKKIFEPLLKKEGLTKIFQEIEMPLVGVLASMETAGILLDAKILNRLSSEAEILIKDLESAIYKLTGETFNINSPKQLKEVLFEKMGLEPVDNKKTKTGLSTSADNLEKMLGQHPVLPKILEYRELSKLQNTYLEALPLLVNKKDGRIHTSYNQTVAATGRLSSSDPNLQNIPVRGEGMGNEIRKAFVAKKGYKFLSIDYSQIELRVVAHLAKDQKMTEVFKNGEDIHTKTAMEIFGVSADSVTKDMRRDAKTINFGILYGVSSFGLSSRISDMSRVGAKEYIKKYFQVYPQVEEYIEQIKLQVNEEGFVRNELGRMRKFPEIKSSQFFIRAAAERAAVNFPIQSLAADVIKVAMINIYRQLTADSLQQTVDCRMLLQVHDELLFEVLEDKVEEWAKKLIPIMENAIKLSVSIKAEAKVGDNWGEMQELKI